MIGASRLKPDSRILLTEYAYSCSKHWCLYSTLQIAYPLTAAAALPAPSLIPLRPVLTNLPPCLSAVRPKDNRSKTAGVGVNLARLCVIGDMGGLVGPPLRFAKAGFTILSSFSFS